MNIWLPIVTNLVLILILSAGIIIGSKHNWKFQLTKLVCLLGLGVGCHFLIPTVNNLLLKINLIESMSVVEPLVLNSLSFSLSFIVGYVLISLILLGLSSCINKRKANGIKVSKGIKVKAINAKTNKQLRKIDRRENPLNVTSMLLGILIAFMLSFVIMIPTKYVFNMIGTANPEMEDINYGYTYTLPGIIDYGTDIVEEIVE